MFTIPAGKLNRIIDIEEKTLTQNEAYGGTKETWLPKFKNIRARVRQMGGNELETARANVSEAEYKIYIRFIPGLNSTHRIKFNGNVLDIVAPPRDMDSAGRFLEILAKQTNGA